MTTMDKQFSLESHETREEPKYRLQLIAIINDLEKRVRYIDPEKDPTLFKKVHERKIVDARGESRKFNQIREDICRSFGVPLDDEHVCILDMHRGLEKQKPMEQRVLRCFDVLIDLKRKEAYYTEGRTIHVMLLNKIINMAQKLHPTITEEGVKKGIEGEEKEARKFLMFKGFMSLDGFQMLSEPHKEDDEQKIYDLEGNPIETAKGWFISGHNLPTEKNP